jgi:recombinational DNA repair ATPase RecF
MARYPDAVGHLRDLATEVDQPWFSFLCDYSIARGNTSLDAQKLANLLEVYLGKETYTSATTPPTNAVVNTPVVQSDKLQRLFAFKNFKLLSETLDVNFTKPITVIFGTNGSGKSSLFEGIKVLANPELPSRPVKNLRAQVSTPSEFQYQFDCDPFPHTWTEAMGHGPLSMTIKYFDSSVAMRNVKVAVEPERIIEVTPFKLSLFETLTGHITTFRKELHLLQSMNIMELTLASQSVRVAFQKYPSTTASNFADRSLALIEADIKVGEQFTGQDLLVAKTADLKELTRATSSEGLTALRTEHRDLKSLISSLGEIHTLATSGWALNLAETASLLVQKRMEQRAIAEAFIPKGVALETFMALLEVTSVVCPLAEAKGHSCPLCQRELGEYEVELFRRYHELLNGLIEKDIETLQTSLARAEEHLTGISKIRPELWTELVTIPPDLIVEAIDVTKAILADSSAVRDPSPESLAALLSLDTLMKKISALAETKKSTIEAAAAGRTALSSQLTALQQEVDQLEYANAVAKDLDKFKAVEQKMKLANYWDETVAIFPPLLRKVTTKAKTAYIDLVVSDFETRLNAEYLSLAERDMASFCVKLTQRGSDSSVTMLPQVGGQDIVDVLSEGEQTIHALALFFAELETCSHCVLVFDDPIASFDYNYSENFSNRLATFCKSHPQRQVIVLTHSWECFVQLQMAMKRVSLFEQSSIQVLEGCRQLSEYSEKLTVLKSQITAILSMSGEPSPEQKESLAGKLRRLVETVVNTLVFNNERHQFKQKLQSTSNFETYTKVTPITLHEAAELKELFSKLSHAEHDDPMNDYTTTSKAVFQTRFDHILAIAAAIESRIP